MCLPGVFLSGDAGALHIEKEPHCSSDTAQVTWLSYSCSSSQGCFKQEARKSSDEQKEKTRLMTAIHSFQLTQPFYCTNAGSRTCTYCIMYAKGCVSIKIQLYKRRLFTLPSVTSFVDFYEKLVSKHKCPIHTCIPDVVSCVFCFFLAVLKRGKTKKGKNDLISAEEGEDPFADISSVGTSYMCCVRWPADPLCPSRAARLQSWPLLERPT